MFYWSTFVRRNFVKKIVCILLLFSSSMRAEDAVCNAIPMFGILICSALPMMLCGTITSCFEEKLENLEKESPDEATPINPSVVPLFNRRGRTMCILQYLKCGMLLSVLPMLTGMAVLTALCVPK